MCGISCILALESHARLSKTHLSDHEHSIKAEHRHAAMANELNSSLDQITHRGPDSRGQWISPDSRVALGHVRLAINDLSPQGTQPFHSPDGTLHCIVNGEFYDYDNIRSHLLSLPDFTYTFRSTSDSELLLALYVYHGMSFTQYLRGEFAFVLWDERSQFFVAGRDRYGIKPLFWTVVDDPDQPGSRKLCIAAEMKSFLGIKGWKAKWDVRSILDAGWNHDERTIFDQVYKIRPGHYLTCQSFGHIEQRQYWDIDYPDKHTVDHRTPEDIIQGVRDHLLESIRLRLRADVPIGVYLSGGIDSSVIAGMVTHLVKKEGIALGSSNDPTSRISCFSIAFDESSGFDESGIANRTAEWLGVKYIKKHMNEDELAKRFEDAVWHAEHHNPDLNFVGKYALSEVPLEHGFKVVLTGEGADENFAGYPVYLPDYLREPDPSWPSFNTLSDDERIRQLEIREREAKEYYESVGADASNRGPSVPRRMLNDISTISSMAAFQLDIFAPWTACYGLCDPQLTIAHNVDGRTREMIAKKWHPLNSAMYVWSKGHLANIFLTCLGDRMEMAHSIEARTPFLDHGFTNYVNGLPPSAKIRWEPEFPSPSEDSAGGTDAEESAKPPGQGRFTEKWVLREAAKPFITEELYKRKKHPYSAPTSWPRNGPLHQLFAGLLTENNVKALGFVDWNRCERLVDTAFGVGDKADEEDKVKTMAMRYTIVLAEWVVLHQRFGVETACAEAPRRM